MIGFKDFLEEGKQVGIVHHYTTFDNFKIMLFSEPPFVMVSRNGETISFSRGKLNNIKSFQNHSDRKVIISVDGDRLSNRYKIKPVNGLIDDGNKVLQHSNNPYRVGRKSGEAEEAIFGQNINILPYITHIGFSRNRNNDKEIEEKIGPRLDQLGVKYTNDRHFSECYNENYYNLYSHSKSELNLLF